MTETGNKEMTFERWRFFLPGPPIALLMFAQALSGIVLTDLIVYRTCLVSLNMTHTECSILQTNASSAEAKKLETQIEPYASMILMAKSLVESILPAVLSLFLGPWSDRGGRRPLLLAGFMGFSIMYIVLSLMSYWDISPWYLVILSIPANITGGFGSIMFASICYISDTTAEENRTMLLGWLQASVFSGLVPGIFIGPIIFKSYGYTIVFGAASISCILALLFTYFCVPETVRDASKESICGLFKISFVKELITSSLLKRDGFHRSVVWLAISVLSISVLTLEGDISIAYLFTRERLGWDVEHYSYVTGLGFLLYIVGILCGVSLLSHVLGLSDRLIAVIGLISALGGVITKSLATKDWHLYLVPCIGLFNGIVGPAMRSTISKSVPAQDLGKVFALVGSLETLSPLGGAPLYTLIYSHYLPPIYPSPVYLLSASFYVLLIFFVIWIELLIRKSRNSNYVSLVHNDH